MGSYILPEGEVVGGGFIKRQRAAEAKRQDMKDAYALDAVRGAHMQVERIKGMLSVAEGDKKAELETHLAAANDRLAAASAAHAAKEKADAEDAGDGETGAEGGAEASDGETETGTPPAQTKGKGRKG